MKQTILVALMFLGMNAMATTFPENPSSESDLAMVAFYEGQCQSLASENKLQDEAEQAFLASCVADMAQVWPVGQDDSE